MAHRTRTAPTKMSRLFTYMPFLIVLSWVIESGMFVNIQWYFDNYYTINKIDTALVLVSFTHFFFRWIDYTRLQKRFVLIMFVICCYQPIDYLVDKRTYFIGYVGILFISIFTIIMLELYERTNKQL